MAEKQLTLPGTIVKKHNELVRSKISLDSLQGSKLLASLIACIRSDDVNFKETYRISAKDVLPSTGGSNYTQIKAACRALAQATVEFEYPDPTDPEGDPVFYALAFFTSVKYRKGIVEARFSPEPEIIHCLLALGEHFTKYNLIEYLRLPSIYSQRIFEFLRSWINSKPEIEIELDKLHHMLNTPESLQVDFAQFRRRVLDKAHKDINRETDLSYEWEPVKRGRAVVTVRFVFAEKKKALLQKEKAKEAREAKSAENNRNALAAVQCLKAKNNSCTTQDNKPEVCNVCFDRQF